MTAWKGRFRKRLHPAALTFSSSLPVDKRLYKEDIEGSLAHVAMLAKQKIIAAREAKVIRAALRAIRREIETGNMAFGASPSRNSRFVGEDVHMAIENRLIKKIGSLGGKLHTARSRNDQVVLDERLYLRTAIAGIRKLLRRLQKAFVTKAEEYDHVLMPGYTHLQRAQPVLLAHHLLAYVSMFDRDYDRFTDALKRINKSPLGAAALAGTSFPIDRDFASSKLGFNGIVGNSIDAVSDRDVQIEFLAACAITMMHLSRFAEELVLWSSQEWNFVEIGEELTTGSSIMPQKKNPDIAELVRGKTGRVYGDLMALLTVMKGLPLAYNRDMQEDKGLLFDAADTTADCLQMCSLMLESLSFNAERFARELRGDFLLATELADYLVRKGLPFREAHALVGGIVHDCMKRKRSLADLSLEELQKHSKRFGKDTRGLLDVRGSLLRKKSSGSTSPKEVRKAIQAWRSRLGISSRRKGIRIASHKTKS